MRVQCGSCYRITDADKCVELALGGMPSHRVCPTCSGDVVSLPPPVPVEQPESTIDLRVKQAQGAKP